MSPLTPDEIVPEKLKRSRFYPTLHRYKRLLADPDAVVPFDARSTDDAEAITALAKEMEGIRGRLFVRLGQVPETTPEGLMSLSAFNAIMERAIKVFAYNKTVQPRGAGIMDYDGVNLRPGDRLAVVEGKDMHLETLLVERAREMGSVYRAYHTPYTDKYTEFAPYESGDGIDALKKEFNHSSKALPLPLALALYADDEFYLKSVHDEFALPGVGIRTNVMPHLVQNDTAAIVEWYKNTKENGKLKKHGEGYHLGRALPATVGNQVVAHQVGLNDGSQYISIVDGRLFVSNDSKGGLGPKVDDVRYQIFKVRKKKAEQKTA